MPFAALPLRFNCGFARAAVRELNQPKQGHVSTENESTSEFEKLFNIPTFKLPANYFEKVRRTAQKSTYIEHCDKILAGFSKRWNPLESRLEYLATFSTEKWKELPETERKHHTLSKCDACALLYRNLQEAFPLKPIYNGPPSLENMYSVSGTTKKEEVTTTRLALKVVNLHHEKKFGQKVTESVVKLCPEERLQKKPTAAEKRKEKRKLLRKVRDKENQALQDTSFTTIYAENESLSAYSRKRKAMCLETQTTPQPKKKRSHIPNLSSVTWDKDAVLAEVEAWPEDTMVNWSKIARDHGIVTKNGGQIVKELARENGMDVGAMDGRPEEVRVRSQKRRLPGCDISAPCLPSMSKIRAQRDALVKSGEIQLGQPCVPFTLTRWVVKNGEVERQAIEVSGRKISLLSLREKLLNSHEEFMHLETDNEIQAKSRADVVHELQQVHEPTETSQSTDELRERLKSIQRSRSLLLWHDHATLLGSGYIMVTVSVLYDPAVFLSIEEYKAKTGKQVDNLQQIIEEPHIHMLALGSSSVSDQLALIGDRVDCLVELDATIQSSRGVKVSDTLRFFTGDKPAQSFERGTQQGGHYKCGGCGVKSSMIGDLAHSLRRKRRSLKDLQSLVLAGKYGSKASCSKPFENLKAQEISNELRARGVLDTAMTAKELRLQLTSLLQGAQCVPTLLIHNPKLSLSSLNLHHYTIIDCEPLHALKGHLHNLFAELPHILSGDLKDECQQILTQCSKKEKITGADLRTIAIHAFLLFLKKGTDELVTLMETIVRVSSILYSADSSRTPRSILQLYNTMWIHHEICLKLFTTTHEVSKEKFFGSYLHDLSCHSGQQYEIVCLRSVNAECQERLFGQAKRTALNTTNRKPNNIIPEILLRLQMRQKEGTLIDSISAKQSKVSTAAKDLPKYKGTIISKQFLASRTNSWQAHLERLSPFLVLGPGVWWRENGDCYVFHDGDEDQNFRNIGPRLHHFRNSSLTAIQEEKQQKWKAIMSNCIAIPAQKITIYDESGAPIEYRYSEQGPCVPHMQPTTSPRHEPTTPEPVSDPQCNIPLSTLTTTGTANQPHQCDDGTISPYPELRVHSGHTSMSIGTSTTTPNHFSPSTPKAIPFKQAPSTPHHTTGISSISEQLISGNDEISELESCVSPSLPEDEEQTTIVNTDINLSPEDQQISDLQTSYAKAIAKVIGRSEDVLKFDTIRVQMKSNSSCCSTMREEHDRIFAQLQVALLRARTDKLSKIKEAEKRYYFQHKHTPNKDNHSTEYGQLMKDYHYICKLLRKLKVEL